MDTIDGLDTVASKCLIPLEMSTQYDELKSALSRAMGSLDASPTEEEVIENVQALSRILQENSCTISSMNSSFGLFRDYIRCVLSTQPAGTIVVAAGTLLLRLMAQFSFAYEELSLSTCLHHMASIAKNAVAYKCHSTCKQTKHLCSPSGHISLDDYKKFWFDLAALTRLESFDVRNPGFLPLFLDAMMHLIIYSRGTWAHTLVTSGIESILDRTDIATTVGIYKALLPIVRMSLPAENRAILIDVVKCTANREQASTRSKRLSPVSEHESHKSSRDMYTSQNNSSGDSKIENLSPTDDRTRCLPFLRFLELSCIHVGDKAEQRSSLCFLVSQVLQFLDASFFQSFEAFILRMSRHPQGRVRLLAVEVALSLIRTEDDRFGIARSRGLVLIQMLAERANDRMPTVRVKAICSLTDACRKLQDAEFPYGEDMFIDIAYTFSERIRDPKSRVRKAAVEYVGLSSQLLASHFGETPLQSKTSVGSKQVSIESSCLTLHERKFFDLVALLQQRSFDTVSNVRLCTTSQVTKALLNVSPSASTSLCRKLMSMWCEVVLPHIDDVDARCKEACVRSIESVLFSWRLRSSEEGRLKWSLSSHAASIVLNLFLSEIGGENQIVSELGRKSIAFVCRKGCLEQSDVKFLCEKITSAVGLDERAQRGVWLVLAEVAGSGNAKFLNQALGINFVTEQIISRGNPFACNIGAHLVSFMTVGTRKDLSSALKESVFSQTSLWNGYSTPNCVSSIFHLLSSLGQECGSDLLDQCEKKLLNYGSGLEDSRSELLLFLIGGVCVSFPLIREPPKQLLVFVLALTSKSGTNSRLRALALTTLGKICLSQSSREITPGSETGGLRDNCRNGNRIGKIGESLARRHVTIFVHELENASSSATRNNAVIVLCDLCRQFTAVVEPYVSRLTGLLADRSDFIRIQVISSLVNLLQEDYIKMKTGPILFQLAGCLVDRSNSVRTTAEYSLLQVASPKNPSLLATSFIELLYVLNKCDESPIYNKSGLLSKRMSPQLIDCDDFKKKMKIYAVFLRGMTAEQRLRLPGRFRNEVLSLVCDGKLSLSKPSVQTLLHDTLLLLTCDEIRQSLNGKIPGENDQPENVDPVNTASEASGHSKEASKKLNLLAQVQKLELRESTIPSLLEIKQHLEKARSPLLKTLMTSLCILLRPHVSELETIIRDSVVRSEIRHEMSVSAKGSRHGRSLGAVRNSGSDKGWHRSQKSDEKRGDISSPNVGSEVFSVPRTRPSEKQCRRLSMNSESDDSECGAEDRSEGYERNTAMSVRIDASPKLATIASRASAASSQEVFKMNVDDEPSGFALALSRIENCCNE